MPYAVYQVARTCRRTRRTLEILATGLTMEAAGNLAAAMREADRANEAVVGYGIQTMPLADQVELLAAGEAMSSLRLAA